MGKHYDAITPELARFLAEQHVFFVATAPAGPGGHVNVSPKGLDTLRILDERRVAYLDLAGSGVETIAHVRENGRITLMACAFTGGPRVMRVYGRGEVLEPGTAAFAELAPLFPALPGVRSILLVHVTEVRTSCGYGVPLMDYREERAALTAWIDKKGPEGIARYMREHDESLDGLPGVHVDGERTPGEDR